MFRKMKQQKQVIIISNENKYPFEPFVKNCEDKHKEKLFEFVYETGLSVPNALTATSQELATDLGELGFCVMLYNKINEQEYLTIYLPHQLSKGQKQYFDQILSQLEKFALSIYYLDEQNGLLHCHSKSSNIENLTKLINQKHEYIEINKPKSKINIIQEKN